MRRIHKNKIRRNSRYNSLDRCWFKDDVLYILTQHNYSIYKIFSDYYETI
jgi:hypothetical protein